MPVDDLALREEIAKLKLTDQQKRFAEAYLESFDANKAMKVAGYGSKSKTAPLLEHDGVQAYIAILKKEISSRLNLKLEDVIREYMKVGFSNIDDVVSWNARTPTLKESKKLTREQKAAIASVKSTREGVEVKMHSKLDALAALRNFLTPQSDSGKKPEPGGDTIHIGEVRIALADPQVRMQLEALSRIFTGKGRKNLAHLDKHVKAITDGKQDSRAVEVHAAHLRGVLEQG